MFSVVQHNKLLPALISLTLIHVLTILFLQWLQLSRDFNVRLLTLLLKDPFHNVVSNLLQQLITIYNWPLKKKSHLWGSGSLGQMSKCLMSGNNMNDRT